MKKLSRVLIIIALALIAPAAIALLAINLYVQSQGTQARIQQELSQRLETPLRIRQISVTPWSGLKLSGITIPQTASGESGDFLRAKTFRLRIHFGSLFAQRLVITEVSLLNPEIVWAQNADGKWRLPALPQEPAPPAVAAAAPATTAAPPAAAAPTSTEAQSTPSAQSIAIATPPNQVAPGLSPEPEPSDSSFVPEIRKVNLVGGDFRFLDGGGKLVASFNGVQFRSNFRNASALRGNASIARTSLRDRFFLQDLRSPLEYDASELDLSQISARAAGGEVTGRFTMLPQAIASPFTASVNFRNIQADQIVADAGGPHGVVLGRLEGRLEANGRTADVDALSGTGEIILRDGIVQQFGVLVAAGEFLRIDELKELHLEEAQVKFHISPGVVTIDQLLLHSANIRLSAKGTLTFEGKLRLESQLAVNEKIRGQLFRAIRDNFHETDDPAFTAVDFQVSGTVDRPKTNLMEKLVGRDLKDIGSVISSFLGGDKSERAKKKREKKEPPAGEGRATPSPEDAAPTQSP